MDGGPHAVGPPDSLADFAFEVAADTRVAARADFALAVRVDFRVAALTGSPAGEVDILAGALTDNAVALPSGSTFAADDLVATGWAPGGAGAQRSRCDESGRSTAPLPRPALRQTRLAGSRTVRLVSSPFSPDYKLAKAYGFAFTSSWTCKSSSKSESE